jgi:hypothetical protein
MAPMRNKPGLTAAERRSHRQGQRQRLPGRGASIGVYHVEGPGRAKFYLVKQDGEATLSAAYYVDVQTQQNGVYVGAARVANVFKKDFTGTYRVLVVREGEKPFESSWVELKVECGPTAGDGKLAPNAPGTSTGKERFDRVKPKVS